MEHHRAPLRPRIGFVHLDAVSQPIGGMAEVSCRPHRVQRIADIQQGTFCSSRRARLEAVKRVQRLFQH